VLQGKLFGPYAPYFWTMLVCNLPIPLTLLVAWRTPLGPAWRRSRCWWECAGTLFDCRRDADTPAADVQLALLSSQLGGNLHHGGIVRLFHFPLLGFHQVLPIVAIWEYKVGQDIPGARGRDPNTSNDGGRGMKLLAVFDNGAAARSALTQMPTGDCELFSSEPLHTPQVSNHLWRRPCAAASLVHWPVRDSPCSSSPS